MLVQLRAQILRRTMQDCLAVFELRRSGVAGISYGGVLTDEIFKKKPSHVLCRRMPSACFACC